MPISFSTQATKNTPYKPFGDTSSGLLGSVGKALNLPSSNNQNASQNMSYPTQNINTSNMSYPTQQGTNPGVLPKPDTTYTHTTTTNQAGGTTSRPTPNPSVLAQQKALNAQGAGLVEDGIAGPLTQAAIAKYGAGVTKTETSGTSATPSATPVEPPKPVSSANPAEQIQNVGQAGQQTQNEAQTQKAVEQAGAQTQWEQDIKNGMAVEQANKRLQDLQNRIAEKYANIESQAIPLEFQQGREQALGRQFASQEAAAQQGVANALTAQGQQFNAAGTQAARQATTAGQAYTGAQTQAQRGLTGQTTVLGATLPTQVSPTNVPFNPVTGTYGEPASTAYGTTGLAGIGGLLQQQEQGAQTQNMIGAYNQAKPLIESAKQQIASAGFNVSPLGLVNQLQQYVNKNVIPSGEYANIFNTLSEIATTISPVLGAQGAQTDLKTMIAQEFIPKLLQGQDIGMVLDNIEKNALAKIQANKATAQGETLQVPTSGGQTGGFAESWFQYYGKSTTRYTSIKFSKSYR